MIIGALYVRVLIVISLKDLEQSGMIIRLVVWHRLGRVLWSIGLTTCMMLFTFRELTSVGRLLVCLTLDLDGLLPTIIPSWGCNLGCRVSSRVVVVISMLGVPRGRTCFMNSRTILLLLKLHWRWVVDRELGANVFRLILGNVIATDAGLVLQSVTRLLVLALAPVTNLLVVVIIRLLFTICLNGLGVLLVVNARPPIPVTARTSRSSGTR